MLIKVLELCEVEPYKDGIEEGIRTVIYNCKADNLMDAKREYEEEFDFDNMEESEDEFDGCCLDSRVVSISEYNEDGEV